MDNLFSNLGKMIDQLSKDKGIDKAAIIDAVSQGLLQAARKKYGTYREIEAHYNEDSGEVELFEFKEVVSDGKLVDEQVEVELTEALKLDPDTNLGESIGVNLETKGLGRIAAQAAKNIIGQKFQDAEREIIFNEFEQRKGEIASGIIRREERNSLVVDLGRTEAYMYKRDQIPGEDYKPGDRIQGYISDVLQTTRGLQIIISRAAPGYLMKLFQQEVPEVDDGIVEIVNASREPGLRAKMSVRTKDPNVDPVGACVGMKGSRVQNVIQELKGEKIDIIQWDADPAVYVSKALSPSEVTRVFIDETNKEMEVIVPDDKLSLAIGKKGQNVRLASRLVGWKLDILSESKLSERKDAALFNLMLLKGMTETMAQNLYQYGLGSFIALSESELADIKAIPGYESDEKASELINKAKDLVEHYNNTGESIPEYQPPEKKEEAPMSSADSKAQAQQRLEKELSQVKDEEKKEEQLTEETPMSSADSKAQAQQRLEKELSQVKDEEKKEEKVEEEIKSEDEKNKEDKTD